MMQLHHLLSFSILMVYAQQSEISNLEYFWKNISASIHDSRRFIIFPCNRKEAVNFLKGNTETGHFFNFVNFKENFAYPYPPNNIIFVADMDCLSEDLVRWADFSNFFASPLKWIFLYSQKSDNSMKSLFEEAAILTDSDVTLVKMGKNESMIMKKIYKFRSSSDIIEEEFTDWNTRKRRRNLQKTSLTSSLVITNNNSLNHLNDKRDKHIDSIAKVNYVIVEHLGDFVNSNLNYTVQSTWGYKNNESKWSGMIGDLTENRADIGGTALFITANRISTIEYLSMTTKTRSKFVFREPKLSYVTNVFVLPFDRFVWISISGMVVMTGAFLYVVTRWECSNRRINPRKEEPSVVELRDSFADVVLLTFGALCQQGTHAIPYSLPGRITTIFLFISLMFLYTSYSANIVALLQSSSKSIQTLEDLLKSRLEVGVDDTVFNHFYFPNASDPVRSAIYTKKVAPPGQKPKFYHMEEGVRKMRVGHFAFHMETGPGYKIVGETFEEGEKCDLQEIQYLQVPDPWLAIQKNSSFKESLKIGLFLIRETGLQNREIDAIYTKKPVCSNRGSSFISVGIVDCYEPAVILFAGIIVSFVIFFLEHYAHHRLKWYKTHYQYRKKFMKRGPQSLKKTNQMKT